MTKKNTSRSPLQASGSHHVYSPEILPQMQALLGELTDLDCAYESDFGTIQGSDAPSVIKQEVLRALQHKHQECRAVLVRRLETLHRRATMRV